MKSLTIFGLVAFGVLFGSQATRADLVLNLVTIGQHSYWANNGSSFPLAHRCFSGPDNKVVAVLLTPICASLGLLDKESTPEVSESFRKTLGEQGVSEQDIHAMEVSFQNQKELNLK